MVGSGRAITAVTIVLLMTAVGCGGSGGEGGGTDTLAVKTDPRVEFEGYSLLLPEGVQESEPASGGHLIVFESGGRLLVFRMKMVVELKLQEMVDLTVQVNASAWPHGDSVRPDVESYKMISLDGRRGLQLAGQWESAGGSGILRAVGTQCGDDFYIIESLHPGQWDPVLADAAGSFRCEE